jgi:hypothetical protein
MSGNLWGLIGQTERTTISTPWKMDGVGWMVCEIGNTFPLHSCSLSNHSGWFSHHVFSTHIVASLLFGKEGKHSKLLTKQGAICKSIPSFKTNPWFQRASLKGQNQCSMVIWIFKELEVLVFQIFQNQTTIGSGCASLKQSESKNHWSNSKILKNL